MAEKPLIDADASPMLSQAISVTDELRAEPRSLFVGGVRFLTVSDAEPQLKLVSALAARDGEPYYVFCYQIRGSCRLQQGRRTVDIRAGDIAVLDTLMPFRSDALVGDALLVMVPQQLITLPPQGFAQIAGLRIPGDAGLGAIVSAMLAGVDAHLESLDQPAGADLTQALVDMLVAVVAERLQLKSSTRSNTQLELLMKIREFIMANLGDLDLNPQRIAEAHYISVRTLHALFKEQSTTVSTWVRERRLEMARRDLADTACDDPIRQIGLRWGFADATHFSNAFRLAYDKSPREYRKFAQEAADPGYPTRR